MEELASGPERERIFAARKTMQDNRVNERDKRMYVTLFVTQMEHEAILQLNTDSGRGTVIFDEEKWFAGLTRILGVETVAEMLSLPMSIRMLVAAFTKIVPEVTERLVYDKKKK